ncbi:hypothetical protein [Streptomyces sp. ISL-100]|uniref:hypothetical protein n=1 Tax=Streptomyces sp. ISL-100 TaxID=2819173 RepID=UPI0035AC0528
MENCTLGQVLDALGESSLSVVAPPPAGLAAPVSEVLLYDAQAPVPRTPGGLLLAVGVRAEDAPYAAAAEAGCTAVVVRGRAHPAPGIGVLAVDPNVSWHRLHLQLASALGAAAGGAAHGDLFALAGALAAAIGGATVIEDPAQRVLAYSALQTQAVDEDRRQGILGRQVPGSPENSEQYRIVFAAPGAVRLPAIRGQSGRLALAVRAGGETLGSIWVVDTDNSPTAPRSCWSEAPPPPPCTCCGRAPPRSWPVTSTAICCAVSSKAQPTRRARPALSASVRASRYGWRPSRRPGSSPRPPGSRPRCGFSISYGSSARPATGGARASCSVARSMPCCRTGRARSGSPRT